MGQGVYVIAGDQTTRDLIKEQKAAHKFFAADYDKAAVGLAGRGIRRICRELFDFCKGSLPYCEEDQNLQTSRSPGAILTIARNGGTCDCKHYSAFIAGMLDSLNRNHGYNIDWVYRFASYSLTDKTPTHVFVVVFLGDEEIWIDPAPLNDWLGYTERVFNDRFLEPTFFNDKSVKTMGIVRLAGIGAMAVQENDYAESWGGGGYDQYGLPVTYTYGAGGGGGFVSLSPDPGYQMLLPATEVKEPAPDLLTFTPEPMPQYELIEPVPVQDLAPIPQPTYTATAGQDTTESTVRPPLVLPSGSTVVVPGATVIPTGVITEGVRPVASTTPKSYTGALIAGAIGAGLLLFFLTRKKRRK